MKKAEFKKAEALIPSVLKESMINFCRMMSLALPGSVPIKTDGSTSLKSKRKRLKAILSKAKARLTFSTTLDKPTKVSRMPRFLYGTSRKGKFSKFRHQKTWSQHAQYFPASKAIKSYSMLTRRHSSATVYFTVLIEMLTFTKSNSKSKMKCKTQTSKLNEPNRN